MVTIIDRKQAEHIAELVRLDISGEEEKFAEILSDTLEYVEALDELEADGVKETYQVTGLTNVFQQEQVSATLTKEEALANAREEVDGLFATEGVFERE